jgi:sensor histidine kinase YesM
MWTVVGVIAFLQIYSSMQDGRHTFTLSRSLQLGLGNACLKGVLSVPVLWGLLRLHSKPRKLTSQLAAYAALLAAFLAAHLAVRPFVIPIWVPPNGAAHLSYRQILEMEFQAWVLDDIVAFVLTATAFHIWATAAELRMRNLREQELRIQLASAELSILKMQLQPHFLFNTLNAIHCLAPENTRKAQQMIEQLSRLLRLSLEHISTNAVPLRCELEFLRAYLDIESTRFEERLRVREEIDSSVLDAKLPSMILQPLVENAIRHGVGKIAKGGTIAIRAQGSNGRLAICITNDAPLQEASSATGGLGLANTRARLLQMFGEDFGLELDRLPGKVRLTMDVPYFTLQWKDQMEAVWNR